MGYASFRISGKISDKSARDLVSSIVSETVKSGGDMFCTHAHKGLCFL